MAIGVRLRFEVFKRDSFTCQYCGRQSPEVILEVDHIVPRASGGVDDIINLRTSCWECNSGKSDIPLNQVVTGEDPHDRSILLLERERQLREYNEVLQRVRERVESEREALVQYWYDETGKDIWGADLNWLNSALERYPAEVIRRAMAVAINNRKTSGLAYVSGCLRNWRERGDI